MPGALRSGGGARARRVFVGVGSSVDPELHVVRALARLDAEVGVVGISTFYVTPALGRPADPPFVDGVAEVRPALEPAPLKAVLLGIEAAEGRRRGGDPFGPRPIDLDLLLHGDAVSAAPELPLPHPDVGTRRFVAVPLLELAPELRLPGSGVPLAALARALPAEPMEAAAALTAALRRRFEGERGEG